MDTIIWGYTRVLDTWIGTTCSFLTELYSNVFRQFSRSLCNKSAGGLKAGPSISSFIKY